jgi:hypothetical protein
MSIYTPKTLDQAKDIATLISDNPRDCVRLHAAFGAHFGGDMALAQNNAYMLKGKPSLNADAMAGIVRRSGVCRFMVITSWDNDHCTYQCARHDEPEQIVHTFTYTIEMAKAQGLTRNRNWQQMPMQMLRARALTLMLRAVYPDAVSGIYSPDELADNMSDISDDERAQISADSLGEQISAAPRAQRAPKPQPPRNAQASRPPQQAPNEHKAVDSAMPPAFRNEPADQVPSPAQIAQGLLAASLIGEVDEETGEVSDHAWENQDDQKLATERAERVAGWRDLEAYCAGLWTIANKPNNATPAGINLLVERAKSIGIERWLGVF